MNKTLAMQALTAAFFISAQPAVFCQQNLAPEDITKPAPTAPSGVATGRPRRALNQVGSGTAEAALAPSSVGVGGAGSTAKRADRLYVSKRDDVAPVMVQFSDKSDNMDLLQEDLTVLTARIRKAIEASTDEDAVTEDTPVRRHSNSSARAIYLDGFGALVFVKVNFPVLGPAMPEKTPEAADDSEWSRARQELLAEKRKVFSADFPAGQPYNPEQVETLKNQVLSGLKDASNIRSLKPGEFVSVTVFGPPAAVSAKTIPTDLRGTVLTIRAQKSDIDALAAEKLDASQFKAKVTIIAYAGSGYGVPSVNSWARSGSVQIRQSSPRF